MMVRMGFRTRMEKECHPEDVTLTLFSEAREQRRLIF